MMRQLFTNNLSVLLSLAHMFHAVNPQQCHSRAGFEESIFGWMLQGHIYKTMAVELPHACLTACRTDDRCQSFNFVISLHLCEFNDRTKEAKPNDFIQNPDRFYIRRDANRVPLGSIEDLPVETCKEIKASEGQSKVSAKYWLYNDLKSGTTRLAYCDMEKEEVDECRTLSIICADSADCTKTQESYQCTCKSGFSGDGITCSDIDECHFSSPVCDFNADCTNTRGSYLCTCKSGFSGDGKTCEDINECTQRAHDCLPNLASCLNNVGSYSCSCNNDYLGDGKTTCGLFTEECQLYSRLLNASRNVNYVFDKTFNCDNHIVPGWTRFEGAAGTRMPTSCPAKNRCGTHSPGWINGTNPQVEDGEVLRKVCFHWRSNCCNWSTTISVRNCGSYFVYKLSGTPACQLRYCGTD